MHSTASSARLPFIGCSIIQHYSVVCTARCVPADGSAPNVGSGNIAAFLSRVGRLMATLLYAGYFAGFQFPWEYADPRTTSERLTRARFTDIETSLEEAPAVLASAGVYREFISDVILRHHLECIPTRSLRHRFIEKLVEQASTDHPPFCLDHRRLNILARKEH
jgi:hypothetical protein